MTRLPLAVAVLVALGPGSRAAEPVTRFDVRPMAAPKPALKYLLLREVAELNPGTPPRGYVRCFREQGNFFYNKQPVAERARSGWMPLAELPAQERRGYGGSATGQADWGARLDTPDWQV